MGVPSFRRETTPGVIKPNAFSVSFTNTGTTDATVLGTPLRPGDSVTFQARDQQYLTEIPYTADATSELTITEVRS
jgi:hypothetical protein